MHKLHIDAPGPPMEVSFHGLKGKGTSAVQCYHENYAESQKNSFFMRHL